MLTRLPAGNLSVAPSIGAASWAFPIVGALIGLLGASALLILAWIGVAAPLAAGVAFAVMIVVTGGLHEDGLADVADGFGGGRDRAHKLEIMRDSQIGSYGGLALVLSLGLRWQGLVIVLAFAGPWAAAFTLIALSCASRASIASTLWLMPPARSDGMGQLAAGAGRNQAAIAAAIGTIMLILGLGWAGIATALAMIITQLAFAALAKRQIGGQTGDVLGAIQQVAEITGWIALSALL